MEYFHKHLNKKELQMTDKYIQMMLTYLHWSSGKHTLIMRKVHGEARYAAVISLDQQKLEGKSNDTVVRDMARWEFSYQDGI